MRTLFLAASTLLALAGVASAEPQKLDEGQLGTVAAGQDGMSSTWSLSNLQPTTTNTTTSNSLQNTLSQTLGATSSATNYATGLWSSGVTASGGATTSITGNLGGVP